MNETEKRAIEQALETEERMLQRQQLLKRLWRLTRREKPRQLTAAAVRRENVPSSDESAREDTAVSLVRGSSVVA